MQSARLARWLPPILIIILVLIGVQRLAFSGLILARGDTYVYFYPYWDARNEAYRAGELPLWTPDIYMGAPLLANPQLGTYYPPNWLTAPLRAPDAIRLSVLMHLIWAAWGAYALVRRLLPDSSRSTAVLSALLYGLGGYVTAHIEQINQLQGLAWMPWLLWLFELALSYRRWSIRCLFALILAAAFAFQFFSGHTQTSFMSALALGVYALLRPAAQPGWRPRVNAFVLLAMAGLLALILALPQLLPTLELTGWSNRSGGFSVQQATAFSFPPHYIGRALLPSYDGLLFTEYIAYAGIIGLGLALYGAFAGRQRRIWIVLALLGLFFALGRFNPIYLLLADLPGFDLFRVPARWLALTALSVSVLAAIGLTVLLQQPLRRRAAGITLVLLLLLMLAGFLLPVDALDVTGPAMPTVVTLIGWGLALAALVLVFVWRNWQRLPYLVPLLVLIELVAAGFILPHNDLAPPDTYLYPRFSALQMQVFAESQTPPDRLLGISPLLFDPGDGADLENRWRALGMDEQAIRNAFVATKWREVIYPNLPLTWGIPSVDGFGGGVLPTLFYTQFTTLMLPPDTPDTLRAVDGRLGERLALSDCRGACIPDTRWLDTTNIGYVLVDKVYDVWHDGIAYDTALPQMIRQNNALVWSVTPSFEADEVRVLISGSGDLLATWLDARGDELANTTCEDVVMLEDDLRLLRCAGDAYRTPSAIRLKTDAELTALAVTLLDSRYESIFLQLAPLGWERVLSSDIKLYHRTAAPRIRIAQNVLSQPDNWAGSEAALVLMRAPNYDPMQTSIIHGDIDPMTVTPASGEVTVLDYDATLIRLEVNLTDSAYLVLADAWYPGWQARLYPDADLQSEPETLTIYRADVMFRAVHVPAGESIVEFRFEPELWRTAGLGGAAAWGLLVLAMLGLWRTARY